MRTLGCAAPSGRRRPPESSGSRLLLVGGRDSEGVRRSPYPRLKLSQAHHSGPRDRLSDLRDVPDHDTSRGAGWLGLWFALEWQPAETGTGVRLSTSRAITPANAVMSDSAGRAVAPWDFSQREV